MEHTIQLGDRGRLVLPAGVRRELDLRPGDKLLLEVLPDGSLRLVSARQAARSLRGRFAHLGEPGVSAADQLIAERRLEAERG